MVAIIISTGKSVNKSYYLFKKEKRYVIIIDTKTSLMWQRVTVFKNY